MPLKKELRGPAISGKVAKAEKRSPSPSGGTSSGGGVQAAGGHVHAAKRKPASQG